MTKRLFSFFCIILIFNLASCDLSNDDGTWNLSIGESEPEDYLGDITETSDGGFVTLANSWFQESGEDTLIYLFKADAAGKILWELNFTGEKSVFGHAIMETDDQGFIIAGAAFVNKDRSTGNPTTNDEECLLIKTDSKGNEIWRTQVGNPETDDSLWDVKQTRDRGYIAVGTQSSYDTNQVTKDEAVIVWRFDAEGNVVSKKNFGGDRYVSGMRIHETEDGDFLITAGQYEDENKNFFLMRIDQMGNEIWSKVLEGQYLLSGRGDTVAISDGGLLAALYDPEVNQSEYIGIKLLRIDPEGNELWSRTIADSDKNIRPRSINQTADGEFIIGGSLSGKRSDLFLMKVNSKGEEIWRRIYGGFGNDTCFVVKQTTDGGFISAGQTNSYLPGGINFLDRFGNPIPGGVDPMVGYTDNIWLIKTDAEGNAPIVPQNLPLSDIGLNNRP